MDLSMKIIIGIVGLLIIVFLGFLIRSTFNKEPRCKKCGSFNIRRGYYTTGWNNYCNQACGHVGVMCEKCMHIEFDKSFEERKRTTPEWCTITR
jgi:hypothetical protein